MAKPATHFPDDKSRALCGANGAMFPKPRGVRQEDGTIRVVIVAKDASCGNCRRMSREWEMRRQ